MLQAAARSFDIGQPPRPPKCLVVGLWGSASGGSRSESTGAASLMRRISRTVSAEHPPEGLARLVGHQQETAAQIRVTRRNPRFRRRAALESPRAAAHCS